MYNGSATGTAGGVSNRWGQYDDRLSPPPRVKMALMDDGYGLTHKGLLCWAPTPSAAKVHLTRLLFIALEAMFAYAFWTMASPYKNAGMLMEHLCLWDQTSLDYADGCSHCSLTETIKGDLFDSEDGLEAFARKPKDLRRQSHAISRHQWHQLQMAFNHEEYIEKARLKAIKYRADHPGLLAESQREAIEEPPIDGTWNCEKCNNLLRKGMKQKLKKHKDDKKHKTFKKVTGPFRCDLGGSGFSKVDYIERHKDGREHKRMVQIMAAQATRSQADTFPQITNF